MPKMTFEQAREALAFHTGGDDRIDDPRWTNGFLWGGTFDPEARQKIDTCLDAVADHLCHSESLDRQLITSLWWIYHLGLQYSSNTQDETARAEVQEWLYVVGHRVACMLDSGEDDPGCGAHLPVS